MITLNADDYFATGRARRCYVNPHNPDQCLKVVIPGSVQIKTSRKFHRRFFLSRYDPNMLEWRCYQKVARMNDESLWRHIPRCHGFVDTTLGRALAVELLRHADGGVSTPMKTRAAKGVDASLKAAWDELMAFIRRTGFYTMQINNINCVRQPDGGERLYFVECKYRRPGLTFLPFMRRRRMEKIIRGPLLKSLHKYAAAGQPR